MSVDLKYKHQQTTYSLMKEELEKTGKAAYAFPTGCGKSFPVLKYIEKNPGKNVLIVAPSISILNQFKKYIKEYVVDGENLIKNKSISLITYQKLSLLKNKVQNGKPDIIVFDEAHRTGAETWETAVDELLDKFPEAKAIAMTATPERTDKRNMLYEKFENSVVYEMSLTDALSGKKEGEVVLKSPRYVRVLSTLKQELIGYKEAIQNMKDEGKREMLLRKYQRLEEIVSDSPDIQDVVAAGMKKRNGKYIVFCENREDMKQKMENAKQIFEKVNSKIKMDYVISTVKDDDGFGKSQNENRKTIEDFNELEDGEELKLLFCVDMLNEGVHLKGIDGEVMFRQTESNIVYKQQIGRVLSADEKAGENVIIDAVNNWLRQAETFDEISSAIRDGDGVSKTSDYDLLKLTPEELELLDILREIGEEVKYNYYNTYNEIIRWLEEHDGKMPKGYSRKDITEEEREERNLRQRWQICIEKNMLDKYVGESLDKVPEEYREKIRILRSYGLGLEKTEEKTTYEEIIEWLEEHNGEMPISHTKENINEEEMREKDLRRRWYNCKERKVLEKYVGESIEKVPEEHREKIEKLRGYGLGTIKREKRDIEKPPEDELIEWLEEHDGRMPLDQITRDGRCLKAKEMTNEENYEVNLRARWRKSEARKILDKYVDKPIEDIPEKYREKIRVLRGYGLGVKEKTTYEELIEWLEEHDGEMPHGSIRKNGKKLKTEEMTEKEKKGVGLYRDWINSEEKENLDRYAEKSLGDVPEKWRDKIAKLRGYGLLGEKPENKKKREIREKTPYEEVIEWLEKHNGQLPKFSIYKGNIKLKADDMTNEEKEEVNLRGRWDPCEENKKLEDYKGMPIEKVPEDYREKIAKLRSYGLGLQEKTPYEEIIEWLETHERQMPQSKITREGRQLKAKEMTKEENDEVNLYARWRKSEEKHILDKYAEIDIEKVPEEYREKIAKLRSLGQFGKKKDDKIKNRMKKSVVKEVGSNEETRAELQNTKPEKETTVEFKEN